MKLIRRQNRKFSLFGSSDEKEMIDEINDCVNYLKKNCLQDGLAQQGSLSLSELESSGGLSISEEINGGLSVVDEN